MKEGIATPVVVLASGGHGCASFAAGECRFLQLNRILDDPSPTVSALRVLLDGMSRSRAHAGFSQLCGLEGGFPVYDTSWSGGCS